MLAGVAAAFLPMFDPACRLAVAAPFSGFTLLLARAVSALAAALLLPSLALCAFALAAATVLGPRTAAVIAGALWGLPVLLLAGTHVPLLIVQRDAQLACVAVLCASAVVLFLRRDRFELGWIR